MEDFLHLKNIFCSELFSLVDYLATEAHFSFQPSIYTIMLVASRECFICYRIFTLAD